MDYNCPYCNEIIDEEIIAEPGFVAPCCSRLVGAKAGVIGAASLFRPVAYYVEANKLDGDTSKVSTMPKVESGRPDSRWTTVYFDRGFHYVRFTPHTDLKALGRPHGLALATTYTSEFEAHRFADSVDDFMDALEVVQKRKWADQQRNYNRLQAVIANARAALDAGDEKAASAILDNCDTRSELMDYACAVHWQGGYNIFTDPNSAAHKIGNLDAEGKSYTITHLIELFSEHNVLDSVVFSNPGEESTSGK
jgi:hypothetical protein